MVQRRWGGATTGENRSATLVMAAWQAMAVCMHRSLIKGVVIVVCFHYT
jgi:hypothetical protein